ncbi:exodeoxyribonuclease V subunit gamma [Candidatus Enterovibrio escicola]|uniref:RecBCD enzyme subunit RecC n=1 Tax=Candidatus Enterovibrio escicola TaxID=1927127 RepID=A0A2A5T658_9GAMM|nr:exodeoxyribonuclease V subunit gamma [Candidatus Enterovibrio escacola]PCS23641.1 Exodeoxyribonuclease V gamma chain [Candidatus Enterovibrio escacola]
MFTVYHSNQLDLLKNLLLAVIHEKPLSNPLQKELILVQSLGMAQWLKFEMAKEKGIVANVEFPLPASFIWKMFTKILSDVPQRSLFNKEVMTWKLMKVLPEQLNNPDFLELKRYLEDGDENKEKTYHLACKISELYDQYLVYRPEWIKAWESEDMVPELEGEKRWQPQLWRALYDYTLEQGQSPFHSANLYERFIDALKPQSKKLGWLSGIERVFIFGVSALPPRYLETLNLLGEHIDVHYMFTNPCRYYWGDIRDKRYLAHHETVQKERISRRTASKERSQFSVMLTTEVNNVEVGNSLLASMGKLGYDTLLMISELSCHEVDQGFISVSRDSLLHHIQADILDLLEPGNLHEITHSESKIGISIDDRSLLIEACYSPMREVEVLHDRLLEMFESDQMLTPRDIVVMVVDITAYSPMIQAVFGNAPDERFIPFSIFDHSTNQESRILSTFIDLLHLPDSRCSASELLGILELPAVLRRFSFDNKQFEKVKFWVKEAGIRWGLNDTTASHFSLPKQYQNTWIFGLNRMLLGYAMQSATGLFNGVLAYDEVQGLEADVAGKLGEFFHVLLTVQLLLIQEKTGEEWVRILTSLFDDMFTLDNNEKLVGRHIRDQLDNWLTELKNACFSGSISLAIVRAYLKEKLVLVPISQSFLAGQVNFCTLIPMRSIPFSVVCLLGMNDSDYPRIIAPVGFDLMSGRSRVGDCTRRDDDRYMFLEALQSAKQYFYISYVGRSVQDNSEKVPSILVTELLDYCRHGYCVEGDQPLAEIESSKYLLAHLVHYNPLVPFSRDAFIGSRASYANEWLAAAKGEGEQASPFFSDDVLDVDSDFNSDVLELTELQRFWHLPVQYFFNRRLKVFFETLDGEMEDTEPFTLDNLHRYQLHDALLSHLIEKGSDKESLTTFAQHQKASGTLPLSSFGELILESEQESTLAQYGVLKPLFNDRRDALEVNIQVPTTRGTVKLQGWLDERYHSGRILYRSGKVRVSDRLATWIDHLCQCTSGEGLETRFFGVDYDIIFAPISPEEALRGLACYLEGYFEGIERPYPYLPNTAMVGLQACIDKKGHWASDEAARDKVRQKMRSVYEGKFLQIGERENPYVARVWPEASNTLLDEMFNISTQVLLPVLLGEEKTV